MTNKKILTNAFNTIICVDTMELRMLVFFTILKYGHLKATQILQLQLPTILFLINTLQNHSEMTKESSTPKVALKKF